MKHLLFTTYLILTSLLSFAQTAVSSYSFTGNADDNLGDNNGVVHGAVLTEDRFGNPNSAYQFDGIDDYINFGDSSEFRFTSSYSLSAWVYIEDLLGQNVGNIIVKRNPNSPYNQYNLAVTADIQFGGNGNMIHFLHKGDVLPTSRVLSSPSLTVGWHHIVIVQNGVDQVLKMYFDNILVSSEPYISANEQAIEVVGYPFEIGGNIISNNHFKGKIDDVSVYHDTLSATAVTNLYNQNGTANCLLASYNFDNSSVADANGLRDVNLGGASFGLDHAGNANNSLKVEGQGSGQIPHIPHSIIDPNNDFTVSYWVNIDSFNTSDNYQYFVSSRHTATGAEQGGLDMGVNQTGEFSCVLRTSGATAVAVVTSPAQMENQWHHVVAVRSNDSLKMYINDVLIGTDEIDPGTLNFPSFWTLGATYTTGPVVFRELSGRLDDLHFYCRALSATEIVALNPLSTNTIAKTSSINWTLYPNPTNALLNIHLEELVEGNLQIINVTGQVIYQEQFQGLEHQLDISNLNTGIYFVQLLNDKGQFVSQKIVKE